MTEHLNKIKLQNSNSQACAEDVRFPLLSVQMLLYCT